MPNRLPSLFTLLALAACMLSAGPLMGRANADDRQEIDAKADAALRRFHKEVKGADEFLGAAKGVLVVPEVKKAGFVVAGQWGKGALRVDGKTVDYYRMDAGSAGFQAGYQEADFVFLFLTDAALEKFRTGEGWSVGAELGVTVVDKAADVSADTLRNSKPVMAFVFGKEGLMGGWSAEGTKLTRYEPKD
jgi:lipid-binding SYLF domain-containing protein